MGWVAFFVCKKSLKVYTNRVDFNTRNVYYNRCREGKQRKEAFKMRSKAEKLSRRRSRIMKDAHIIAKKIVNNAGSYQVALSFALKFVYAFREDHKAARVAKANGKQYQLKFDGMIYDEATRYFEPKMVAGVPAWAIRKDFMHASAHDIIWFTTATKEIAETEKAVQIEFTTANPKEHGYIDHHTTWVAKSIMAA